MTILEKLKELLDKMNRASSAYSDERHIGGTLLGDFSRAENRLCESAIAMLPSLLAVAEAAALSIETTKDLAINYHREKMLVTALAELDEAKLP